MYYLYFHINPITKQIFYVGVGYNKRAYVFKWGRSKHYLNYIKKYGNPLVQIIHSNINEDEAYNLEVEYIKFFGRKGIDPNGILVNKSSGGKTSAKGNRQYITNEWKKKIGDSNRGKKKHNIKGLKSISDKNSKPIIQLDLNGNFIREFNSIKEASTLTTTSLREINNYLQNPKNKSNFIWKYKENSKKLRKGKRINQYDKDWNFIKTWDSINQAQRELNIIGINQFLKGKSYYVSKNKFKFKYYDND